MKACANHQETLMLDIHEELPSEHHPDWDLHLRSCAGCRQERERLQDLLRGLQNVAAPPRLSTAETRALSTSILRKLRQSRQPAGWRSWLWRRPARSIPTFAFASLLVVVGGWFLAQELAPTYTAKAPPGAFEEQSVGKDLEVIRNMDLLEEIDDIQKIIELVDSREMGNLTFTRGLNRIILRKGNLHV
jgi:hypothetical protein